VRRLAALCLCLALLTSCGQPDPAAIRASHLEGLLDEAFEAGSARLRYNPGACACPPYEVQTGSGWVRVDIVESSDPAMTVEGFLARCRADHDARPSETYSVFLSLEESKPDRCPNGTLFFKVALEPAR
jgi:hypothetical protein